MSNGSRQRLDGAAIQAEAEAEAGLADPDRDVFGENLDRLIESVNRDSKLSKIGYEITHREFVQSIRKRLESIRWLRDHPDIADERIVAPVFLTGLPRSGTTYVQNLFDVDPTFRQIRAWEGAQPTPPPAVDPESARLRLAEMEREMERRTALNPEFNAIHLADADGPDECHPFLTQTFSAAGYHNFLNVPDYFEFLTTKPDLAAAYRNHKTQLKLLQWKAPRRRWALKYPNHLIAMDAVLDVYPDARFVITHRDPRQTLASICRLTDSFRAPRSDYRDKLLVGRQMRAFIRTHLDGLMAFHRSPFASRAVYVDYYRTLWDPGTVMAEIYAGLGMEIGFEVRSAIAEWLRRNPKNKRGANDYALAEYGLDPDEIADEYGDYIRAFDIPSEADAVQGLPV